MGTKIDVVVTAEIDGTKIALLSLTGDGENVSITLPEGKALPAINALKFALTELEEHFGAKAH